MLGMGETNKSLSSIFVFGLLLTLLVPFAMMDAYAAPALFGMAHIGSAGPSTLYSIDKGTGAPTPIGPTGFERCSGMDFNTSDGTMYATCERLGTSTIVLVTIDLITGIATEVGPSPHTFGGQIADLSFRNSDDKLYAYLEPGDGLGTVDIVTGAVTALGTTGVFCCGNGMAFTPPDILWHANSDTVGIPSTTTLGTLDQVSGLQTDGPDLIFSPPMDAAKKINAMDWDDSTGTMFGSCNDKTGPSDPPENHLCTVDLGSGVVTVIGPTVDGLDAIAFVVDSAVGGNYIPIDSSALLLAGVQSISMWMIPVVIAGIGIGVFVIKRR